MFPRTESKAHPDTITGRPRRGPLFRNGYRRQASGLAAKILRLSRETRVVTFPPLVSFKSRQRRAERYSRETRHIARFSLLHHHSHLTPLSPHESKALRLFAVLATHCRFSPLFSLPELGSLLPVCQVPRFRSAGSPTPKTSKIDFLD
jgi:hypothetical protein